MSVLSVVLSIAWPGAATPATHHLGRPELWNLVMSMAILGLLYRWIAVAKREQAARLREKVVPFAARQTSRIVTTLGVLLVGGVVSAQTPAPAPTPAPPKVGSSFVGKI